MTNEICIRCENEFEEKELTETADGPVCVECLENEELYFCPVCRTESGNYANCDNPNCGER